jgi:hypothetical protein
MESPRTRSITTRQAGPSIAGSGARRNRTQKGTTRGTAFGRGCGFCRTDESGRKGSDGVHAEILPSRCLPCCKWIFYFGYIGILTECVGRRCARAAQSRLHGGNRKCSRHVNATKGHAGQELWKGESTSASCAFRLLIPGITYKIHPSHRPRHLSWWMGQCCSRTDGRTRNSRYYRYRMLELRWTTST